MSKPQLLDNVGHLTDAVQKRSPIPQLKGVLMGISWEPFKEGDRKITLRVCDLNAPEDRLKLENFLRIEANKKRITHPIHLIYSTKINKKYHPDNPSLTSFSYRNLKKVRIQ